VLNSSIVSGNAAGTGPDMFATLTTANYSALGTPLGITTFNNNKSSIGAVLKFSGLASHGGAAGTFALLPGSAVIDQGRNSLSFATDQRGTGFARLIDDPAIANNSDGTDVGAYEVDPAIPVADGIFADVTTGGATSNSLTVNYYTY